MRGGVVILEFSERKKTSSYPERKSHLQFSVDILWFNSSSEIKHRQAALSSGARRSLIQKSPSLPNFHRLDLITIHAGFLSRVLLSHLINLPRL